MIVNGDVCAMPGFLLHSAKVGRRSAPHPAEPELPRARAELRALPSAARSAAAVGGWMLCSMWRGALLFCGARCGKTLRTASGRAGAATGASRASRTPECGTLCCRLGRMDALLHVGRSSSFLRCVTRGDAPHRIRQSRSCRGREQSFAHSGHQSSLANKRSTGNP